MCDSLAINSVEQLDRTGLSAPARVKRQQAGVVYLGPRAEGEVSSRLEIFMLDIGSFGVAEEKALAATAESSWRSGRDLLQSEAPDDEVTIAGICLASSDWHVAAKFDGRDGKPTAPVEGGAKRQVIGGTAKVYPRTDPVAIGLIESPDGLRCLLGRGHRYPPGMYTCLSGFVDQCEGVEEAFRREAFEEAGVQLGPEISIAATQPWPIGRAGSCELMIGCRGRAMSDVLRVNKAELEDAQWFTRLEVNQMLQRRHPKGLFVPPQYAIANQLIVEFATARPGRGRVGAEVFTKLGGAPLAIGLAIGLLSGLALARLKARL
ncbi:unnamed protein product [Polarella glacialis]|uniref:NAD(+) diphosphatase n=1 Tax=Polarella glacialis TaxID=89957 RepID=A0A813J5N7_POLGL|nr:unnamed protein product [Polarella glacialis]